MTRVAINGCYGGFGLSDAAFERLLDIKNIEYDKANDGQYSFAGADYYHKGYVGNNEYYISPYDYHNCDKRDDIDLIKVIEELGEKSFGRFSKLKIVDIPDDVDWYIEEYDGNEWIAEKHRTWC